MEFDLKLVYIEWCDAIAGGLEWTDADAAKEWGAASDWVVREAGWLVEENEEYIVIASAWKPEDELCNEQFKHLMKIPTTWIKKRVDLTEYV
ncbi:MAG: hypothetical protein LC803_09390 [Acidobacteria bacterium]|nr:hypothetical protein [Acidobacteriota bacterium]